MNIVLYDNEHFETLVTQARILHTGANRVCLAVTQRMQGLLEDYGLLSDDGYVYHIISNEPAKQPQAVWQACRAVNAELLLLGTVAFRHASFAWVAWRLRGRTRVFLGIHDLNAFFDPAPGKDLRALARRLGLRQLRRRATGFVVLLEEMKTAAVSQFGEKKPIVVIPGSISTERLPVVPEGALRILVPGSVDKRRRSYAPVSELASRDTSELLDITVLGAMGGPDNQPDISAAQDAPHIRWVTGAFVAIAEFEALLQNAELVWSPLPETFAAGGRRTERYGVTKSTGSFFDAIRHGKPLILPASVPVPSILASATLRYEGIDELHYLLLELSRNTPARLRLQQLAAEQSAALSVERVRARVLPLLTGGA